MSLHTSYRDICHKFPISLSIVLFLSLILLPIQVFSEDKKVEISFDDIALGVIVGPVYVDVKTNSDCYVSPEKAINDGEVVCVTNMIKCLYEDDGINELLYEIFFKGVKYYIKAEDVFFDDKNKNKFFKNYNDTGVDMDELEKRSLVLSLFLYQNKVDDLKSSLDKLKKYGLCILNHKIFDTSEYTDGTGFSISIMNQSKKTIKYVSFTLTGYNAVNDPVPHRNGKSVRTVKGVGPIKNGESSTYEWDYMWFTDLVETHKISSIQVEYMDKSKKVFKNIKQITLPYDQYVVLKEINEE